FDSVCVDLLNQAYDMFHGHEPPPEPSQTIRQAALALAITQLGTKESPANTNQVKYTSWYGMIGPWCAMFCTWCFDPHNVGNSPSFDQNQARYAYVPYIVQDGRNAKNGLKTTDDPIPGDLVCYDWGWDNNYDHVGIFEAWTDQAPVGKVFTAIEGNTSVDN